MTRRARTHQRTADRANLYLLRRSARMVGRLDLALRSALRLDAGFSSWNRRSTKRGAGATRAAEGRPWRAPLPLPRVGGRPVGAFPGPACSGSDKTAGVWGAQTRSPCKPRDCLRARDHSRAGWITPNNSEVDRPENLAGPSAVRVRNGRSVARHGYWPPTPTKSHVVLARPWRRVDPGCRSRSR